MKILTISNKSEEKFLKQKTVDFDFSKFSKKEIYDLVAKMKKAMIENNGIGLSANQIGLNYRVFVAKVPSENGSKFYAIFNPKIIKTSKEEIDFEEGCLSVPKKYGLVRRPYSITLEGRDKNNHPIKIKAWGLLARVFEHEVDHLDGKLFIDRTKNIRDSVTDEKK